jgi:putative tryptophan/tyrosine transport system substrate-binding protein
MRRRDFVKGIAGSGAAWPFAARAQQSGQMRRIGVLMPYAENDPEVSLRVTALHEGLLKLGWMEGRNIRFEHRWPASDPEAISRLAREIVNTRPDVILTDSTPPTAAVLRETHTIPVVFVQVGDPVGSGFVASFQHPGGNATGFNNFPPTLTSKWLELLMEIVPHTARVMYLFNPPTSPFAQRFLDPLKSAASSIGVEVVASPVYERRKSNVIAGFSRESDGDLIVLPSAFMLAHRDLIIAPAERYRLPAIYPFRYYAEGGGLVSYGSVPLDAYHQAATYIDQILRGANPADLPVQMSVKFELAVNLKTAKAMGLKIPESFLVRADKVIE